MGQRDLTAVSSVLTACNAWGRTDTNPAKTFNRSIIRAPREEIEAPTPEQLATVLRYAPAGMAAVLRFLDATGCRLQEAAQLERRRVDWQAQTVTLYKTKSHPRTIRFATSGGDCSAVLSASVSSLVSPFVFRNSDDTSYSRMSSNFRQLLDRVAKAETAAGRVFRRFRIHDLRHWFALRWLRSGASIYELKTHLGHTSVFTTEGYLHYVTEDEQRAVRAGPTLAGTKSGTVEKTGTDTAATI